MPLGSRSVRVTFVCPKDLEAEVERLAEVVGVTKSTMCKSLVEMGVDDAHVLEKLGALKMLKGIRGIKKYLGVGVKESEVFQDE